MRFEAKAAAVIGVLLPVLETYRRGFGYWRVEFTTMFEDYLAAALLLVAAWAARKSWLSHRALLLTAWAWFASLMTISFIAQIETTVRGVAVERGNVDVLAVKTMLLAVSISALIRSYRSVMVEDRPVDTQ